MYEPEPPVCFAELMTPTRLAPLRVREASPTQRVSTDVIRRLVADLDARARRPRLRIRALDLEGARRRRRGARDRKRRGRGRLAIVVEVFAGLLLAAFVVVTTHRLAVDAPTPAPRAPHFALPTPPRALVHVRATTKEPPARIERHRVPVPQADERSTSQVDAGTLFELALHDAPRTDG